VQQAVAEGQAFQCAFCMSGFIMATAGFLKTNPKPTRKELAHGISGNLCRCADYNKILNAMMHASELMEKS
jgi:aerobic-type carbon monoxide dehydrogenase small subunit (CoxS/CutS family)